MARDNQIHRTGKHKAGARAAVRTRERWSEKDKQAPKVKIVGGGEEFAVICRAGRNGTGQKEIKECLKALKVNSAKGVQKLFTHHPEVQQALEKCMELPGGTGLLLGNFLKMTGTHADEQLVSYLWLCHETMAKILPEPKTWRLLDPCTVQKIESMAPAVSELDRRQLEAWIDEGTIFSKFNATERAAIWSRLQKIDVLILSVATFFKDLKRLMDWSQVMKRLFEVKGKDTIWSVMEEDFRPLNRHQPGGERVTQADVAQRHLAHHVMQHIGDLEERSVLRDQGEKCEFTRGDQPLREVAQLARSLGFANDKLEILTSGEALPPVIDVLCHQVDNRTWLDLPVSRRSGRPYWKAYQKSRDWPPPGVDEPSTLVTVRFTQNCVFRAFFDRSSEVMTLIRRRRGRWDNAISRSELYKDIHMPFGHNSVEQDFIEDVKVDQGPPDICPQQNTSVNTHDATHPSYYWSEIQEISDALDDNQYTGWGYWPDAPYSPVYQALRTYEFDDHGNKKSPVDEKQRSPSALTRNIVRHGINDLPEPLTRYSSSSYSDVVCPETSTDGDVSIEFDKWMEQPDPGYPQDIQVNDLEIKGKTDLREVHQPQPSSRDLKQKIAEQYKWVGHQWIKEQQFPTEKIPDTVANLEAGKLLFISQQSRAIDPKDVFGYDYVAVVDRASYRRGNIPELERIIAKNAEKWSKWCGVMSSSSPILTRDDTDRTINQTEMVQGNKYERPQKPPAWEERRRK